MWVHNADCCDLSIGETNPRTGHKVLASHKIETGSNSDYIIEATKPSTKGKLVNTKTQYYENPGHHDPKGTGISTEVLLTSITAQKGIQGGTNKVLTVIDTDDELRQDSIQTLAHELDHIRGGKNETLADLAGLAAKLNTDAAIIANQDKINPIKAQLRNGKDAHTTAQNQALLEGNDKTFVENHDGREGGVGVQAVA